MPTPSSIVDILFYRVENPTPIQQRLSKPPNITATRTGPTLPQSPRRFRPDHPSRTLTLHTPYRNHRGWRRWLRQPCDLMAFLWEDLPSKQKHQLPQQYVPSPWKIPRSLLTHPAFRHLADLQTRWPFRVFYRMPTLPLNQLLLLPSRSPGKHHQRILSLHL